MSRFHCKGLYPFLLTIVVIFLDRVTKQIVVTGMQLHESIPFLGDVVRWTYIHNDGMAFGVELTSVQMLGYLSLIAVVAVIFIILRMDNEPRGAKWILAVVLGGAIGNTYDRLKFGYVIDFIDVDLPDWLMRRWPVFNVADIAVSVGIIVLMILMVFYDRQQAAKEKSDAQVCNEMQELEESDEEN